MEKGEDQPCRYWREGIPGWGDSHSKCPEAQNSWHVHRTRAGAQKQDRCQEIQSKGGGGHFQEAF